jgi:hypothetical protein
MQLTAKYPVVGFLLQNQECDFWSRQNRKKIQKSQKVIIGSFAQCREAVSAPPSPRPGGNFSIMKIVHALSTEVYFLRTYDFTLVIMLMKDALIYVICESVITAVATHTCKGFFFTICHGDICTGHLKRFQHFFPSHFWFPP